MARGFTLLELLISVTVLTVMLAFAVPQFSHVMQQIKITNLANEIQGFLVQAKSEAVFRNQELWLHIYHTPSTMGDWKMVLSNSETVSTGDPIALLEGHRYNNISLSNTTTLNKLKFESVMGNPIGAGNFFISPANSDQKGLKVVVHNRAGRIRICSLYGSLYGFHPC